MTVRGKTTKRFCSKRCKAIKQNDEGVGRDYQDQVYIPMEEDIFYIPTWDRIED